MVLMNDGRAELSALGSDVHYTRRSSHGSPGLPPEPRPGPTASSGTQTHALLQGEGRAPRKRSTAQIGCTQTLVRRFCNSLILCSFILSITGQSLSKGMHPAGAQMSQLMPGGARPGA